jgi:hypothetical protein
LKETKKDILKQPAQPKARVGLLSERFSTVAAKAKQEGKNINEARTPTPPAREPAAAEKQPGADRTAAFREQVKDVTEKRGSISQSKGFNVRLLGDIWLLSVMFASITVLIDRERKSEVIGWFPDRDDMTNWCDGIWHYYAFWNSRRFADDFDVDMRSTQLIVALPDREGGGEIMWFDYLLRAADWFAGAVAEWDRKTGFDSAKHPKYREMWEQVIAGARNVVVLHLDIGSDGAQFRRIEAQRIEPPEKE